MAIGRIPEPGTGIPESIVDAKGDIITATAADTPARLAVGTNNQTLVAASGEATGLKYANGSVATLTAKGDLLTATAANTISRLAVGANGTTLVADSAEATGLKWATPAGGGKVLQVVSTTKDDAFSTTATSFTDVTGLSVSITPSSATSKVLVMMTAQISGGDTGRSLRGRLMRGATAIAVGTSGRTYMSRPTNADEINSMAVTFLDSPATTSATTYNTQILSTNGSLAVYVNRNEGSADAYFSTITVMEIGA
jgi:hypothetical protein